MYKTVHCCILSHVCTQLDRVQYKIQRLLCILFYFILFYFILFLTLFSVQVDHVDSRKSMQ